MDAQVKKYCPNCSQLYVLNVSQPNANNFPLFLSCGHSMCEKCVGTIVKFGEPIECKVCHRDMAVDASDVTELTQVKNKLYKLFPVNVHMLGELYLQHMEEKCETQTQPAEQNCFLDLKSLLQSIDNTQGECLECQGPTTKMCQQCATILCNNCFNKIHKNFAVFKTHCLKNIGPVNESNDCKLHKGKPLDYYCKDCSKAVCMNCMMVGGANSCKNHNVASIEEINEAFFEELSNMYPKVDEVFRRLTKTAVDIGQLLYNIESGTDTTCETTKVIATLEQHFSKLDAQLHKHKLELTSLLKTYKASEKESLHKAKADVAEAIKKAKVIMNTLSSSVDNKLLRETNLSVLLQNAKEIVNAPWYLKRDEPKDPLQVVLNEPIIDTITNYISFKGENNSVYKLCSTTELDDADIPPAPPMPSYPPELPKDVRQSKSKPKIENTKDKKPKAQQPFVGFYKNAPHYRSKSTSVSSLNSASSESSMPSYNKNCPTGDVNQMPAVQTVMPFAETQHRRQLHEGSQEVIYITHIVDPHNFYVQMSCHQGLVKAMLREFRNAVSLPRPSLNHIAEGKIYLVYNRADNMWQRGRVVSVDKKNANKVLIHMFCIDFGSTEIVTIDKMRLVPPRLNSHIPLAMNCSLANCEPKAGSWNSDDAFLIKNIIDNKQAVIHVRQVRSTSVYTLKFDCDVTTFEDGVSLAHALVFHERARMIDTKLPYPKILGSFEKPKIFANTHDLQPKSVEEVYITSIASPDKFFVRKRHLQDVYEKLSDDMEMEYGVNDDAGVIYLPEVGMVCAVNLSKVSSRGDDVSGMAAGGVAWARGHVTELPGRGRVRVFLVDCGAVLLVHWAALRRLPDRMTVLGALAMECHLAGVTPLNKKWSPKAVALLQRFSGRLLRLQADDVRGRGSLGVTLYDDADDEDIVCVNTLMIKHKLAVSFGMFTFDKDNSLENQTIRHKSPPRIIQKPPEQKPLQNNNSHKLIRAILKRPKSCDIQTEKEIKEEDLAAKDKGPLRLEAKVLYYQSPSLIYISLTHQQKVFNKLFDNMQIYYNANKQFSPKEDWKIGDRCCVLFNPMQTWRRAVIVDIQANNAKIFFSDFASVETAPLTILQELTTEFASVGDAAIKCHLCGVIPVGEEWPSLTKEYLKELLDAYKRVFITKMGNFKDKSMPIEIWVYHTIQGGALEPDESEWRCLNKKIIEQGLGIPDKSQETNVPENTSKTDDEMLSFLNIKGSVTEWVRLQSPPTTRVASKFEPESTSSSPDNEDVGQSVEAADETVFITDWLAPEPLQCKEFYAVPTYIDNHGVIYLHDVSQQDTLDLIRKALDVRFKDPDPKAKYAKWRVGEPCVALFFLDNRFYRGRVLEVNKDTSTCLIHYVDYGNEEICSFANMRKSTALYQIPVQAHKCILNRIRPVGTQWDRKTLDYVHKSVVEKQCLVKVTGEQVGDTVPIDLKYDKLWFNDHLVDFELAVYTDGSKVVVRKFQPVSKRLEALELDSPSPDFATEDAITPTLLSSSFQDSLDSQEWVKLIDDDERTLTGNYMTYPKHTEKEFMCNIMVIHDLNELELNIIHDDESSAVYDKLYADIQNGGGNCSPLNGIYENKACIAMFPEDTQWYRASILQYSEVKNLIKVKYIDYGNIGVISLADVREINEKWVKLPPATITAKLWGVKLNRDVDMKVITKRYADTLLDKGPFHMKIVGNEDSSPLVELRNDSGDLVYENLLNDGIFLKK